MPFLLPILDAFSRRPIKYTPMRIYALNGACTQSCTLKDICAHNRAQQIPRMCYTVLVRMAGGHNQLLAGEGFPQISLHHKKLSKYMLYREIGFTASCIPIQISFTPYDFSKFSSVSFNYMACPYIFPYASH